MSIPILLAAFLLADPDPDSTTSILGASPFGQAGVRAFESSLLANVDPLAAPAKLPFAGDDKGDSLLSYTYAEIGYERTDVDVIPDDLNAYYAKGSFGFLKFFNVVAGVERADTDTDNIHVDTYWIGGGAHFSVMPKLDVLGELDWLYDNINGDSFSADSDTGVSLYLGGRFMALDWDRGGLEVDAGYRWTDLDAVASDTITTAWEFGVRAHFIKFLSVGVDYAFIEDDRRTTLNVRFSF
jgi:hypothetical protein